MELVKEVADDAGVPRSKANLHAFRHRAISGWLSEGFSEKAIKHRAQWVETSDMLRIYDHVLDEEINKKIAAKEGVYDPEDANEDSSSDLIDCDLCETAVRSAAEYCLGCGHPQTIEAANQAAPKGVQSPSKTADQLDQFDGVLEEMDVSTLLSRIIEKDPSLLEEIPAELLDS